MSYLIIGASSGLGRDLAYTFAEKKNDLILVSRDEKDLTATKSDLEIKHKINVKILNFDYSSFKEINSHLFSDQKLFQNLKGILFPIGHMYENDGIDLDIEKIQSIIFSNYLSTVYTVSKLKKILILNQDTTIVGFGSISSLIGRQINSNYAAAKRALESYFESLAFEFKKSEINVQFYMLGYLDTNLAFGKNLKLPKGSTKKLSKIVFKNRKVKYKKTYFPFFWILITFLLKIIPFSILLKLNKFLR
tara:strand:- start:2049 stop:2792 length:744 start_codon:yes stop_codon:yes gene_type:complete